MTVDGLKGIEISPISFLLVRIVFQIDGAAHERVRFLCWHDIYFGFHEVWQVALTSAMHCPNEILQFI